MGARVTQRLPGVSIPLPSIVVERIGNRQPEKYAVELRSELAISLTLDVDVLRPAYVSEIKPTRRRKRTDPRFEPPVVEALVLGTREVLVPPSSATEMTVRSATGLADAGAAVVVHIGDEA